MLDSATKRFLPWVVAIAFFMQTLDGTILNTALPSMARGLGESPLRMQSVVVAYLLTVALVIPASGWLADRFDTRRVFSAAILLFSLDSLLCALSPTLPWLVAARVVQGVGGALLLPLGRLTILRAFPRAELLKVLAFVTIPGLVGPLLGPPLGSQGLGEHAMSTAAAILMAIGGLASMAAHWVHAARVEPPLFSLSLFKIPTFSVGIFGNLLARLGSGAMPFLTPLFLQVGLGYSPSRAGLTPTASATATCWSSTRCLWRRSSQASR